MIDDHDTHPGCPGQNPESRKMVVCVLSIQCIYLVIEISPTGLMISWSVSRHLRQDMAAFLPFFRMLVARYTAGVIVLIPLNVCYTWFFDYSEAKSVQISCYLKLLGVMEPDFFTVWMLLVCNSAVSVHCS